MSFTERTARVPRECSSTWPETRLEDIDVGMIVPNTVVWSEADFEMASSENLPTQRLERLTSRGRLREAEVMRETGSPIRSTSPYVGNVKRLKTKLATKNVIGSEQYVNVSFVAPFQGSRV